MKYILLITIMAFSVTGFAAGNKSTAQQKVWTDDYQYGANENPKDGEFEVAPRE